MEANILLESGTGDVEILEFIVDGKNYGINVIKIREISEFDNLTKLPLGSPSIAGLTLHRDEIVSLVDLKYVINQETSSINSSKIIICEFNKTTVAFTVDSIVGIHRLTWKDIRKSDGISSSDLVIGNIVFDKRIILLLDFEKIVTDINPELGIKPEKTDNIGSLDRSKVKLALVDDSAMIRQLLKDTLSQAGYEDMRFFNDGKEALDYLNQLAEKEKEDFIKQVNVLITDIEMPQMDGHTLTRKIKGDSILKSLPIIIFSSLITDDLKHKGTSVGADAQISKPEVSKLIEIVDSISKENISK